jgi:PAS domain S-box-containing protein
MNHGGGRFAEQEGVARVGSAHASAPSDALPSTALAAVLDAMPDATIVVDAEGTIVHATARIEDVLGHRPCDLTGRSIDVVMPRALGARPATHLLRARRSDGSDVAVEASVNHVAAQCGPLAVLTVREVPARLAPDRAVALLRAVTAAIAESDDFTAALARTLEATCGAIGAVYAEAWLPSGDGRVLSVGDGAYASEPGLRRLHRAAAILHIERGISLPGEVWRDGAPRWIEDVRAEPLFARRALAAELGVGAALTVPVMSAGEVLAVMQFVFSRPAPRDDGLVALLATAAPAFAVALRRRRDHDLLRDAQAHFTASFAGAADGMVVLDRSGRVIAANPAFCAIHGRAERELLGARWEEVLGDGAAPELRTAVQAVIVGTASRTAEEGALTVGGRTRWLHVTVSAIAADDDRLSHCFVHVQDVTDRKEAELAVARQAALLDLAHDAVIVRDRDGHVVFWNKGAETTYGWSSEEAIGQHAHALFDLDGRTMEQVVEHAQAEGAWQRELEHRTKAGARIVVESRLALQHGDDGGPTGYLEVNRDITARKDAERALRATERRVEQVLAELPVGVVVVDAARAPVYANGVAVSLLGERPEDGGIHALPIASALAGESTTAEVAIAGPGHSTPIPLRMRAVPLLDDAGQVAYALAVVEDVTAEREAEAALNRHMDELARSNRELEQFAYVTSHDLSEPLRSVAGFSHLLVEEAGDRLDETSKEFLGFVVEGIERMQVLIADLLTYSRAGRGDLRVVPVDLGDVAGRVCGSLARNIEETGAKLTVGDLPTVAGDDQQLEQVLQNLVANAIKFRRSGTAPVIEIAASRGTDGWEVAVSDNGIGIEPRHRERIFQMFQRLHTRDEYEGTGIGLALCKKAIERHGGTIHVETAPGGGSRFVFTLPDAPGGSQ